MEKQINSLEELGFFADKFIGELVKNETHATIIGLSGELGSGKTAFVKAIAQSLDIKEDISSPTFVIAKFYELSGAKWARLIHIDAYRLNDPNELNVLRFDQLISDPKHLIFLEWPEIAKERFPSDAAVLKFKFINETTRTITQSAKP